MANENVKTLTNDTFQADVIDSEVPVLVDFWAEWCGPCRMMAPVLDELANEMDGQVRIAKLNIDQHQDLAIQYGVTSIPSFILFQNGEVKDRTLGAMPKGAIQEFITRNMPA